MNSYSYLLCNPATHQINMSAQCVYFLPCACAAGLRKVIRLGVVEYRSEHHFYGRFLG